MALCDQTDVEAILGITFDNNPEPRVTALIDKAAAVLAGWLENGYDGATIVATFDGDELDNAHRLYLPSEPDSVTSVVEDGVTLTVSDDYLVAGNIVTRVASGYRWRWASGVGNIVVTYDEPAEAPEDIRLVCAGMVARLFVTREAFANGGLERAGIKSERAGRYSVTYDTDGDLIVNGRPALTTEDMRTLSQSGAKVPDFA